MELNFAPRSDDERLQEHKASIDKHATIFTNIFTEFRHRHEIGRVMRRLIVVPPWNHAFDVMSNVACTLNSLSHSLSLSRVVITRENVSLYAITKVTKLLNRRRNRIRRISIYFACPTVTGFAGEYCISSLRKPSLFICLLPTSTSLLPSSDSIIRLRHGLITQLTLLIPRITYSY